MTHLPLLDELAVIAALAVAVSVVLARLRLPTVAGLLAAGAMVGPYGLALVDDVHDIEALAEVGVVLLLFSIGLEFSLARLRDIFRQVAMGGLVQVGVTGLVTYAVSRSLGQPVGASVVYGCVFALSSTAIVLRALAERRELDAPHGRFIVGTLIFQDLCVVPMVLVVPLLGAGTERGSMASNIGLALLGAAAVVVAVVGASRFLVPRVLDLVDAAKSREVFLLAILGLCLGTAWLTSLAGLSLALGAFLGGMVVADTEYGHRAMGEILPLRDAFVSLFFVSLGMLFDVGVVLENPVLVAALLFGFLIVKGLLATIAALVMRFPARVAWLAGVGLAQFGEFGFVLTRLAQEYDVIDAEAVAPLLAAGILSMFLTPVLVRLAPHVSAGERLLAPLERLIGVRSIDEADVNTRLKGHVVIVGFGLAGRVVAGALLAAGEKCVVLELNADNVRRGRAMGLPVYYGDATSVEALHHAHIEHARLAVLLTNDPQALFRIIGAVRQVVPELPILSRVRYLTESAPLLAAGATQVMAEEVEGAVEIISRVLGQLDVPRNVIHEQLRAARSGTQASERRTTLPRRRLADVKHLDDLKVESVRVRAGAAADGRSAVSLNLRVRTGATVVGLHRGGRLADFDASHPFHAGDAVFLVGPGPALEAAIRLFDEAADEDPDELVDDA